MTNYREAIKQNKKYLDRIDFIPYLEKFEDLKDLINSVKNDYDSTYFTTDDFLCGSIFNYMDRYDIKDYLNDRYKDKYNLNEYEYYEPPIYIKKIK